MNTCCSRTICVELYWFNGDIIGFNFVWKSFAIWMKIAFIWHNFVLKNTKRRQNMYQILFGEEEREPDTMKWFLSVFQVMDSNYYEQTVPGARFYV